MKPPLVHWREPLPPHERILVSEVQDLAYAFKLMRPGEASFKVSREDPSLASYSAAMELGACVSIEREDGQLPWVGFVRRVTEAKDSPYIDYQLSDHAGFLFGRAAIKRGAKMTGAWGDILTQLYSEADSRGTPPLLAELDVAGGAYGEFTPQAGTVLSLLDTAAKGAEYEWGLRYSVGPCCSAVLDFSERQGRDRSGEVLWEDGLHFTSVTYTQDAAGEIGASIAVGGGGDFAQRDAVILSRAGSVGAGIQVARALRTPLRTFRLAGTSVYVDPQLGGSDALYAAAARMHEQPQQVAEQLSFSLYETAVDLSRLELGSYYSARLSDLNFGHAREMVIRLLGIQLGADGVIDCESQVMG